MQYIKGGDKIFTHIDHVVQVAQRILDKKLEKKVKEIGMLFDMCCMFLLCYCHLQHNFGNQVPCQVVLWTDTAWLVIYFQKSTKITCELEQGWANFLAIGQY